MQIIMIYLNKNKPLFRRLEATNLSAAPLDLPIDETGRTHNDFSYLYSIILLTLEQGYTY